MRSHRFVMVAADPGTVRLCENFVDTAEESALLEFLEGVPVVAQRRHDPLSRFEFVHPVYDGVPIDRREAAAGWPIWVDDRPQRGPQVPQPLVRLLDRSQQSLENAMLPGEVSTELTSVYIDRYQLGVEFVPHVDRECYGEHIVGISLGPGTCVLRFRSHLQRDRTTAIHLPPRSMYAFSGELRHGWTHEILGVSDLRYSITFRGAATAVLRDLSQ